MRAAARLAVTAGANGYPVLSVLRGEPPLVPRRTGTADDGAVLVHLVGAAAGPLGGDRLSLDVEVGPGAALEIRSVAATVVLPRRGESVLTVTARVAAGGVLRWLPEPLVAAARCHHLGVTEIDVAAGGRLTWREELVCGRHGEPPGDVRLTTSVRYAGRPLLVHEVAVGPSAPGWAGPAVLGGAGAVGTVLVVDGHPCDAGGDGGARDGGARPRVLGPTAAVLPLAGPGRLTCATGVDAIELRALLDLGTAASAHDVATR